ncbi:MAG: putative ATPase [Parasphingorhabdus sp.]|jgi:predicted ATPase
MIAAVSTLGDKLQAGLEQLTEAEILYRRGRPPKARYFFKHALVQDAAYNSLLKRNRQRHHRNIAELIEQKFSSLAESNPEIPGRHHDEAGNVIRAIRCYQKVGEKFLLTSANEEAIAQFGKALELNTRLSTGRDIENQELSILLMLTPALVAARGYAATEVESAYQRALELGKTLGDTDKQCTVVLGLAMIYQLKAEMPRAKQLS